MKSHFSATFAAFLVAGSVFGQATMTSSGDWAATGNWTGSNIGDNVTETVTIDNNINPTVNTGTNLTVGTTTLTNNNTVTINSGGTLNIGDASHPNSLITTNNNTVITVSGTLIVWGSLQVNNNVVWNITGTVIIKGNVTMANNSALNVTGGTMQVGGNFTGGNNTAITVPSGSITVSGTVDVGNGSTLSGCSSCFQTGSGCTGPSTFCSNSILPITLVSFEGKTTGSTITLEWSTATELNFEKFVVERSGSGEDFTEIGTVAGHGTSNQGIDYSFEDEMPATGKNYYRLRSVDFDGKFENSRIIRVEFNASAEKLRLYPNPVTNGVFNVATNFTRQEGDKILIYNNVGMLVGEGPVESSDVTIGKSFNTGMYTLFYVSGSARYAVRFVVK